MPSSARESGSMRCADRGGRSGQAMMSLSRVWLQRSVFICETTPFIACLFPSVATVSRLSASSMVNSR